jgi:hypothetical protein
VAILGDRFTSFDDLKDPYCPTGLVVDAHPSISLIIDTRGQKS